MKRYKQVELSGDLSKSCPTERQFYEDSLKLCTVAKCCIDDEILEHVDTRPLFRPLPCTSLSDHGLITVQECVEEPQSYAEWKYFMSRLRMSSWSHFRRLGNRAIYILPVGPFPDGFGCGSSESSLFILLKYFGQAYFPGITFHVLPSIEVHDTEVDCRTRLHKDSGHFQILMSDMMRFLEKVLPKGAFGIIAVSWFDFYPCETMNHILGEGSAISGCAAFSCGHYGDRTSSDQSAIATPHGPLRCSGSKRNADVEVLDMMPLENPWKGIVGGPQCEQRELETEDFEFIGGSNIRDEAEAIPKRVEYQTKVTCCLLWRMMKAFSHELCHTFGLKHCQFFECCMNGSSSVTDAEKQPLFLCPVCLRKLQQKLNFPLADRYNSIKSLLSHAVNWCDTTSSELPTQYDDCGFVVIVTPEQKHSHVKQHHASCITHQQYDECRFIGAMQHLQEIMNCLKPAS